jgi:hypothetical protein
MIAGTFCQLLAPCLSLLFSLVHIVADLSDLGPKYCEVTGCWVENIVIDKMMTAITNTTAVHAFRNCNRRILNLYVFLHTFESIVIFV